MTADEMFKELGYTKEKEDKNRIIYKRHNKTRSFEYKVIFEKTTKDVIHLNRFGYILSLGQNLTKAINKKVEELGW